MQAEKRKRLKEEAMVEQKDAILRKYASAVNSRMEKQSDSITDNQKPERERPVSDISYISNLSGSFISFGPNVEIPSCIITSLENEGKRYSLIVSSISLRLTLFSKGIYLLWNAVFQNVRISESISIPQRKCHCAVWLAIRSCMLLWRTNEILIIY